MLESLIHKINLKFKKLKKSELQNLLILSLSMLGVETVCLNKMKGVVGQITGKEGTKKGRSRVRITNA